MSSKSIDDLFEEQGVLFVTDDTIDDSSLSEWLPWIPFSFASTTSEAYATFDSTISVVCLFDTQLDDEMETFRRDVLLRRPFCQFIVIESEPYARSGLENYDATLQGPISRRELQNTVQSRLLYATYGLCLYEYYLLNMRTIALGQSASEDDAVADLSEQIDELRQDLQQLSARISAAEIQAISKKLKARRDFLTQSTKQLEDSIPSKYRPDVCPECDLVWGEDHGNALGKGHERLGAGVWRCTRCEEISHELHNANQSFRRV